MRVKIYTDGACSGNPGPGGWAAIFAIPTGTISVNGYSINTTNNRMELCAVIEGLRKILNGEIPRSKKINAIDIHSDSAYVVNAINNQWITSWYKNDWKTKKGELVKNQDLWKELMGLLKSARCKRIDVSFVKVKGHAGNTLNEMADKLAVEASNVAQSKVSEWESWR